MVGICGPKPLAQFGVTKMMIRDENTGWLCDYKVKTCSACFRFKNTETSLTLLMLWTGFFWHCLLSGADEYQV